MTRIYLVRHGESEDNALGIVGGRREAKLTDRGIKQVELTAAFFARKGIRPNIAYTSPQARARQSADIITTHLSLPTAMLKAGLQERDFGVFTGIRKEEIGVKDTGGTIMVGSRRFVLAPKGGESFPQVIARAQRILDYVRIHHEGESVLIVSHAITGLMMMSSYYSLRWEESLKRYRLANASITLLDRGTRPQDAIIFEPQ